MTSPLLSVRDLRVDIPSGSGTLHAVRGLDFDLNRGEVLCIVGESGSGKSLTSLSLMGLLGPSLQRRAARMEFDGIDLLAASPRRMRALRGARMAMIFQEPMTSLNPAYTIGDQLIEALRLHRRVSRAEARDRAVDLLEKVGITAAASRLGQYPHQLSGGLRQRVMIAMALMCGPELIIADEPTTALDVTIQAQILRLLVDLVREMDMAMILITHDLGVVARVADSVAVMYAGELVETGRAAQLFERPLHPYTRGLLNCIPQPGRTRRGAPLGTIPGIVPSLVGAVEGCVFRTRCTQAVAACHGADPGAGGGRARLPLRPRRRGARPPRRRCADARRGQDRRTGAGTAERDQDLFGQAGPVREEPPSDRALRPVAAAGEGRGAGPGRRIRLRQVHAGQDPPGAGGADRGRSAGRRRAADGSGPPGAGAADPADLSGPLQLAQSAQVDCRHRLAPVAGPRGG